MFVVPAGKGISVRPAPGQDGRVEAQGVKTAAVKVALRTLSRMLRSHSLDSLLRFVETYGSSSVASTIRKYAGKIADIVDKLLTWADVPLKAIEDQITGGLNGSAFLTPRQRL